MLIRVNEVETKARRNFMGRSSGLLLSGAAVALMAGNSQLARAAAADPATDVGILGVALALEHEAIAAYQVGAESGLLQKPVLDLAVLFQSHHKGHRDALIATIEKLGGKPAAARSNADYATALGAGGRQEHRRERPLCALSQRPTTHGRDIMLDQTTIAAAAARVAG